MESIKFKFQGDIGEYESESIEFQIELFTPFLYPDKKPKKSRVSVAFGADESFIRSKPKKKITLTPHPLNILFQEFPFVINQGTYTFDSCYTPQGQKHKTLLFEFGRELHRYEITLEITNKYVEALQHEKLFEHLRQLWLKHLIKCYKETEERSIDKIRIKQDYIYVFGSLLEHKGALNDIDPTLLVEYTKLIGYDENENTLKKDFYWIRLNLSNFLNGRGNNDIKHPIQDRYAVQALAYYDFLKWLKGERNDTMFSDKVKNLFLFIEFLHANIENFNRYNNLINELELLNIKRTKLRPESNYKDKLEYDKVQSEIENKFNELQTNTANLIEGKARVLKVCDFNKEPIYNFNGIETDIAQLKKSFNKEALPIIFKHKKQYIEYRNRTHKTFLSLQFFFDQLDEIAKSLFGFFNDTAENEFESFETKTVTVDSIEELAKGFRNRQHKFVLTGSTGDNSTKSKGDMQTKEPSKTFKLIHDTIDNIDKTQYWKYTFRTEDNFKAFVQLLTEFFEFKNPELPPELISIQKGSKSRFLKALKPLHKELSEKKLNGDTDFFNILRTIKEFSNLTDTQIYSALNK